MDWRCCLREWKKSEKRKKKGKRREKGGWKIERKRRRGGGGCQPPDPAWSYEVALTCRKDSNERSSHLFLRVLPPPNLSQLTWKQSCTEKASERRDSDGCAASLSRIKVRPGMRNLVFLLAEKLLPLASELYKKVTRKCIQWKTQGGATLNVNITLCRRNL